MRTRPRLAALALAALAVLAAAAPAAAHGDSVHLDVTGRRDARVSAVATWEDDHDPVTGEFAGTLFATASDGRTVGPWRLVTVPDHPGTYTTREALPAGHWRVTVDCAVPAPGHGERELDVDAVVVADPALPEASPLVEPAPWSAGTPGPLRETAAALVAARQAAPGPVHATTSVATVWAAVGTACTAVVLVATGLWLRRHRG
ncbi:hypothetical protein [Kitasatospora brasiliensis]|uniref:hypothetical protein n=1 Tax=Kitasatospora brasiliensis TaxID=3058040 RepID=UPI00292CEC35|nr:hypothetical protein [Kitasatospora sp. K002]